MEATPLALYETHRWTCPEGCGYFRVYNTHETRRMRLIHHPVYGDITEVALVERDISTHRCHEYRNALIRLNRRRALRYRKEMGISA